MLPEQVKVGPFLYRVDVEYQKFRDDEDTGWLSGQVDHNNARIRVMQCDHRQMYSTLWHEILHAIDNLAGTDLTEDQVSRIAPLIAGVLIDNPEIRTLKEN